MSQSQDVIKASGGKELSIDSVNTGGYTPISGPSIRETASGQLEENGNIVLTLPSGYEWNSNLTGNEITVSIEPTGAANTQLAVSFTSISATEATFTVDTKSSTRGNGQGPGRVDIDGLELRPSNTNIPDSGQISNTGSTAPASANYGDLSKEAGAPTEISIETKADGTGQLVQEQDLIAGVDLQVFAISRDMGGNFVENIALSNESDWSLINITGNISQSALDPASNLRSATFDSEQTGTAQIKATFSGLTAVPSQTLTVLPREANEMVIITQPASTAIAGEKFDPQPKLELRDKFGNTVTTDSDTQVSAKINSRSSSLQGTLTEQVSSGIVTFNNLSYQVAETISLSFQSAELDAIVSGEISVESADPDHLIYLEQPTHTLPDDKIDPPVKLQLLDKFDNDVNSSGINAEINESSGSFLDAGSTISDTSDSNGIITFDNLHIDSGASEEEVQLTASSTEFSSTTDSETFEILSQGELAEFQITATDDTDLGEQEAGQPFDIKIRTVDGTGSTYTAFDQKVTITADADISSGGGETTSFTNGVLSSHSITLTSSGTTRIYAENTDVGRDGRSNEFNIAPTDLDLSETTVSADPSDIEANGSSTSTITVQARDKFGNNLETGGETVEIVTDSGTLSTQSESNQTSVSDTDNQDGTYSATLTSSTAVQTATIEAFNNDQNGDKLGETTVEFTSGDLNAFAVLIPQDGGEPKTQTAGESFNITVQALDSNNNPITDFNGDLLFTANSEISSGSTADGGNFSNGELTHSITLTESGENINISVEEDNLDEISGTSEDFEVVANNPVISTSEVNSSPDVLQNDGSSKSTISVILRDVFGNRVFDQQSVSMSLEQLEEYGNPSSGQPDATISSPVFDAGQGRYTATLSSSTTVELVEVSADFNGNQVDNKTEVNIVLPNTWTANAGGPSGNRTDWTNPDNWSLGRVPSENDFVIIPDVGDDLPILDLNISVGSFEIQQGVTLELFGGNVISTSGNTQIDGSLDILDNTELEVGGNLIGSGAFTAGASTTIKISGDISLNSYLAGENSSITRLNGENQQIITTLNFLSNRLEIDNDVLAETTVDLIDIFQLDISDGNTLELVQDGDMTIDLNEDITGSGTFILNNNTFVLRGNVNLQNIDASEGTVIFGIRLDENFANFPDLEQQQIANLSQMKKAVINNTEGVRMTEDIIVDGDSLVLENGELIISSGKSLIAPKQIYNGGSITFRRTLNSQGWIMLSSPVNSDFGSLLNGLTLQGITNSKYPDRQPNLLYYDETTVGTDNQRWRTPGDTADVIRPSADSTGHGFFFYVFGDVQNDNGDYDDTLPVTLTVNGEEYHEHNTNNTFDFTSVTYTAEADTGWNLVGNPWGATLDWDDGGNWTKTNIDDVIYVWDPETNDYLTWNGIDGSLKNGLIKPFQAFWIKANDSNPELSVDKSAKTTGGDFYGKSDKAPASIEFLLESGNLSKKKHITLSSNGRNNKDSLDAYRLLPFETDTYLEFYTTLEDGTQLAINNLARSFGKEITIPLFVGGFRSGEPINEGYTISWPKFGDVPEEWTLTLIDKKTDKQIDLQDNTFYSFNLSQSKKKQPLINNAQNFNLTASVNNVKAKSNQSEKSRFILRIDPGVDGAGIPEEYSLGINYPNPFSEQTTIKYNTPVEGEVELLIYDILGRRVKTLLEERRPAAFHELEWNPTQLASGVYIVVMRAGGKQFSKKMTFIK